MRKKLEALEVPIPGSDRVTWIELSVPSTSSSPPSDPPFAPLTEDAASCHKVVGDPPTYLIWRIHKSSPHALELIQLIASEEFPSFGLRLIFQSALSPFAYICRRKKQGFSPYMLYVVTVSGVAFLLKLNNFCQYDSDGIFPQKDCTEYDLRSSSTTQPATVTCISATLGCLVVGRHDGSVSCFRLGALKKNSQGFIQELRDDAIMGRFLGLMGWGRTNVPVKDLALSKVYQRKRLFVIHVDGSLRVWDFKSPTRILKHNTGSIPFTGASVSRLWVGDANKDTDSITLAISYTSGDVNMKTIAICILRFKLVDDCTFLPEPSVRTIILKEETLVDLKITPNRIVMLRDHRIVSYDHNSNLKEAHSYALQEAFVGGQLFQCFKSSSDDLIWTSLSSLKDQVMPFVSSIFLRRLLHPGVYHSVVLRATLQAYNHWAAYECQSFTIDCLKKVISQLVESEAVAEHPLSVIYCWKHFCTRYSSNWLKFNTAYGLFVDTSTGAIGLIRQNSISLFRGSEGIEFFIYGTYEDYDLLLKSRWNLANDRHDYHVLFEVLRCNACIKQHLGSAPAAIFYESVVSSQMISTEEYIPYLLKKLETGYNSSGRELLISELGADTAWKKEVADHTSHRKFSVQLILLLRGLYDKASSWDRILNAIKNHLKFLVPCKSTETMKGESVFSINAAVTVHSTAQVSWLMFESAFDILLLLGYLVNNSAEVNMNHRNICKVQTELIPMIEEILSQWLILHLLGTTPCESLNFRDFPSRFSSLPIDSSDCRWFEKLGTCDFTLACLLFVNFKCTAENQDNIFSIVFPCPSNFLMLVCHFSSWVIWGDRDAFFSPSVEIAIILIRNGQHEAVENLFAIINSCLRKERSSQSVKHSDGESFAQLHLLGICLLARAKNVMQGKMKERKVREAVRCFFRASSGHGVLAAMQYLSLQGMLDIDYTTCDSVAAHKLHYYQWAMDYFEKYNCSEESCQFALAALEQVDEVFGSDREQENVAIRGRLWGNVFKFNLELKKYQDAYCALISNPDEDGKYNCMRRFIVVLCEHGDFKTLCDGQLPFVGFVGRVEQELACKAERSDIAAKLNSYKLLYAFETHRHNWRRAARYMYMYSSRLKSEVAQQDSLTLQARLNALSAAINALHLIHPSYAWIDPQLDGNSCLDESYSNKKAKNIVDEISSTSNSTQSWKLCHVIDIETLEKEFLITSAEYMLSLTSLKLKSTGNRVPSEVVDLLVQGDLYDMAFSVLLKFWKGSTLKRELERIFVAMALKCCTNRTSKNEAMNTNPSIHQSTGSSPWKALELYLEKYTELHPGLPVYVAETLLQTDFQIELPLWLVHIFKSGRRETSWEMTGQESNAASLLRLYISYGRFAEATKLLLEYIEYFASLRLSDITNWKRMSAAWFPYTTFERLWCQLEELSHSGYMVGQCEKLKGLLQGALAGHLEQLKEDSDDAVSSAVC